MNGLTHRQWRPLRKQRFLTRLSFLAAEHILFGTKSHSKIFINAFPSRYWFSLSFLTWAFLNGGHWLYGDHTIVCMCIACERSWWMIYRCVLHLRFVFKRTQTHGMHAHSATIAIVSVDMNERRTMRNTAEIWRRPGQACPEIPRKKPHTSIIRPVVRAANSSRGGHS